MSYFHNVGWDIAGTEEYAAEVAVAKRVQRANVRLESGRQRSMNSNTKANRKAYGVESDRASFTLYDHADPEVVARVLGQATFLTMTVQVGAGGEGGL